MQSMSRDPNCSPFGPIPAPRKPQPGEPLYELKMDGTRYRCELRDFSKQLIGGVEAQILANDELWQSCRFFDRALAVRWAEGIRDRLILREQIDWP
jgi:hypothetical protein